MSEAWRTVCIFISSTFVDMHGERDHLVRVVFPELRERCAGRRLGPPTYTLSNTALASSPRISCAASTYHAACRR